VLKDVSYGAVSAYMAVSPGQYTAAMRGGLNACAARTAPRQAVPVGATDGAVAYGRTRPPGSTHACFAGTGQHD
jgi:hypothetical protein